MTTASEKIRWGKTTNEDGTQSILQGQTRVATIDAGEHQDVIVSLLLRHRNERFEKEIIAVVEAEEVGMHVDLSDESVEMSLVAWSPEVRDAIASRDAIEREDGKAFVETAGFKGLVIENYAYTERFIDAVANMPMSKCLVVLAAWEKTSENALPKAMCEFQLAGALNMPDAEIVCTRMDHLRNAGLLEKVFSGKISLLDHVLRILAGEVAVDDDDLPVGE